MILDSDLAAQSVQGSSKKKKVLNETELALRREENARKRKSLSEKKLEDEKVCVVYVARIGFDLISVSMRP